MGPISENEWVGRIERLERANRALAERLDRSERTRRRLVRFGGVAALLLVGAAAVGARGPGRVVEAERLVIRDWDGAPRIELGANDKGVGYLLFYDRDGTPRIDLGCFNGGGGYLLMSDPNGRRRIDLGTRAARAYLILHDRDAGRRIDLGVDPDGRPYQEVIPPDPEGAGDDR